MSALLPPMEPLPPQPNAQVPPVTEVNPSQPSAVGGGQISPPVALEAAAGRTLGRTL
jgi:hypothetical protein